MRNKYFALERDIDVPLSAKSPRFITSLLTKQLLNMTKVEEDLTRLPSPGECLFINAQNWFNPFALIVIISKREPIKRLVIFTSYFSISEYNSLIELQEKGLIEQIEVVCNTKPVFVSSSINLKILIASITANELLIETHHNDYVFSTTAGLRVADNSFFFYSLANDKEYLQFRYSVLNNPQLPKE